MSKLSTELMRINHSGEICAQALYRGSAAFCRAERDNLLQAAAEEKIHLSWCHQRLQQLNAKPSRLNPLWYAASYAIGAITGILGKETTLAFIAETEQQVSQHLATHLTLLPGDDYISRNIVKQMLDDELEHAHAASQQVNSPLKRSTALCMRIGAKIFTLLSAKL